MKLYLDEDHDPGLDYATWNRCFSEIGIGWEPGGPPQPPTKSRTEDGRDGIEYNDYRRLLFHLLFSPLILIILAFLIWFHVQTFCLEAAEIGFWWGGRWFNPKVTPGSASRSWFQADVWSALSHLEFYKNRATTSPDVIDFRWTKMMAMVLQLLSSDFPSSGDFLPALSSLISLQKGRLVSCYMMRCLILHSERRYDC